MKEEFFSKFIDYNNRLEKILETKDFSHDVKNLLLSMLYKIDISYSDYQTVKRNVKNKQAFLEDVLRIIENCEKIELVKPSSEEGIKLENNGVKYEINPLTYEIRSFENEKVILEALFELDNTRFYLPEKYNLIRIAFPDLLNEGKAISNVEVIRDFNAWSWNILENEISNFYANIVYQNIEFLIGKDELEEILINDEIEDKIELIKQKLENENLKEDIEEFMDLIYQISINYCISNNSLEKKRLLDEKKIIEEEYHKFENKEIYLEEITQIKKERHNEIRKIDKILNDKELLSKEYKIRNQKLKEYNKILNIEHLIEILNKQRKKAFKEIDECNELLQPLNYIKTMEKLKIQLELLKNVEEDVVDKTIMEDNLIELQIIFLNFLKDRIKRASKKEIVELLYIIRYYCRIPFSKNQDLRQHPNLSEALDDIKEFIINRMYEFKQINRISEDEKFNIKVLTNIFDTKIINLENIYIQLKSEQDEYVLEIYDKEILENRINLSEKVKETKELKIRKNKIIKVFI